MLCSHTAHRVPCTFCFTWFWIVCRILCLPFAHLLQFTILSRIVRLKDFGYCTLYYWSLNKIHPIANLNDISIADTSPLHFAYSKCKTETKIEIYFHVVQTNYFQVNSIVTCSINSKDICLMRFSVDLLRTLTFIVQLCCVTLVHCASCIGFNGLFYEFKFRMSIWKFTIHQNLQCASNKAKVTNMSETVFRNNDMQT